MRMVRPVIITVVLLAAPDPIAAIREAYGRIERQLSEYRHVRHDLQDFSLEGGYLDAWFDASHLQKLRAMYYGETYRGSESYYFVSDTLVFMLETTERYDEPMSGHVVRRDQNRFYFHDQQLIRWVDSTRALHSTTDAEARERSGDLLREARLLVACAKAPPADTAACTAPPQD